MSLFLKVVPVSKAIEEIKSLAVCCGVEAIPLPEAHHRVLAEDIRSDVDIPGFTRSVVDGYAVQAADTTGSSDAIPSLFSLRGRVAMGASEVNSLRSGQCMYVPTGGVLPKGADAVVMIEHAEQIGTEILVKKPAAHGENILLFNEDYSCGEIVCKRGRRLSPQETGVLAAAGCIEVPVVRIPKIGVLSTGNELVPVNVRPFPGQVRDVNTYMVASYVREQGCTPVLYGIVRDDQETLRAAISTATAECDAVLISGGSSKDERDMVAAIIGELGEVLVHGIAISPGKPTIIGRCGNIPVIGLPGHPASAFIVLVAIVRHLFAGMTGDEESGVRSVQAVLGQNVPSSRGREDYVRVVVHEGVATPLFGKSGLLNTLVKSDGIIRIPAEREGLESGTIVEVMMW